MTRNFTPRVASAILTLMPTNPATAIQNEAPGPPVAIAMATPAMFPRPTVPDNSVARAWKLVTSPGSVCREKWPRITWLE